MFCIIRPALGCCTLSKVVYSDQLLCAVCYTHYISLQYLKGVVKTAITHDREEDGGRGVRKSQNIRNVIYDCPKKIKAVGTVVKEQS